MIVSKNKSNAEKRLNLSLQEMPTKFSSKNEKMSMKLMSMLRNLSLQFAT